MDLRESGVWFCHVLSSLTDADKLLGAGRDNQEKSIEVFGPAVPEQRDEDDNLGPGGAYGSLPSPCDRAE